MKKTLVIWMKSLDGNLLPKFEGSKKEAYHEFFSKVDKKFNTYFVFGLDAHIEKEYFSKPAVYSEGKIGFIKSPDKVKADIIYHYNYVATEEKTDFGNAKIINSVAFKNFGSDKWSQYLFLKDSFPDTVLLENKEEVVGYVDGKVDNIVLKPRRGESGNGVVVVDKGGFNIDFVDLVKLEKVGYLGQDFLDTSQGIPNIVDSTHDLRIVTMLDKVVLCHVRIPERQSLVANTHKGAIMKEVDFNDLPQDIKEFYKKTHTKLRAKFENPLYSMDIGFTKAGPKLFEINAHTAFPRKDFKSFDFFIKTLIEVLDR